MHAQMMTFYSSTQEKVGNFVELIMHAQTTTFYSSTQEQVGNFAELLMHAQTMTFCPSAQEQVGTQRWCRLRCWRQSADNKIMIMYLLEMLKIRI